MERWFVVKQPGGQWFVVNHPPRLARGEKVVEWVDGDVSQARAALYVHQQKEKQKKAQAREIRTVALVLVGVAILEVVRRNI